MPPLPAETMDNGFTELCVERWGRLTKRLSRGSHGALDEQHIADGLMDALLHHQRRPEVFDRVHGLSPEDFLALIARRKIVNRLRAERRRKTRELEYAVERKKAVELAASAGNIYGGKENAQQHLIDSLAALLPDPIDQAIFAGMRQGVRSCAAYVASMGIAHLPLADQRRHVQRAKDRILKFLRRKVQRWPDLRRGLES